MTEAPGSNPGDSTQGVAEVPGLAESSGAMTPRTGFEAPAPTEPDSCSGIEAVESTVPLVVETAIRNCREAPRDTNRPAPGYPRQAGGPTERFPVTEIHQLNLPEWSPGLWLSVPVEGAVTGVPSSREVNWEGMVAIKRQVTLACGERQLRVRGGTVTFGTWVAGITVRFRSDSLRLQRAHLAR